MHGISTQHQQWYQIYDISQILVFDGYLKVREYLGTCVIIFLKTILNHVDTRAILLRCEGSSMVYESKW